MPNAKNPDTELIRAMRMAGRSLVELGKLFGISKQRVAQITGKTTYKRICKYCSEQFTTSSAIGLFCRPICHARFRRFQKPMTKKANRKPQEASRRMPMPHRMRFAVLNRDSFTCQYCGRKAPDVILHCDHIKPVSKGGTTDMVNLITACFDCNMGKSDTPLNTEPAELLK